jgi:AraC-like DNA-binding protein
MIHEFVNAPSRMVRSYTGYVERGAPATRVEAAQPEPVLVISFGPLIAVDGAGLRSFVGGLGDSWAQTSHEGEQAGVQVRLDPFAARALLGMPIAALANQVVALDDVLGPRAAELEERLAGAPSWDARFALLDELFARRLAEAPAPPSDIRWAWQRLHERGTRVDVLARELGWSRRHFSERFKAELGLAPKTIARLMRFNRATQLMRSGDPVGEVALDCGYYDQAHLNRDFRAFAGCTPTEYAQRLPFVQDATAAAA